MLNEKRDGIGRWFSVKKDFQTLLMERTGSNGRVSEKQEEASRLDVRARTVKMMGTAATLSICLGRMTR